MSTQSAAHRTSHGATLPLTPTQPLESSQRVSWRVVVGTGAAVYAGLFHGVPALAQILVSFS